MNQSFKFRRRFFWLSAGHNGGDYGVACNIQAFELRNGLLIDAANDNHRNMNSFQDFLQCLDIFLSWIENDNSQCYMTWLASKRHKQDW